MKVTQLSSKPCNRIDYTVHGILQARILECVAFPFSRGIFPNQESNSGLPLCRQILQAPPSVGFSRQEYWIGLPFPSPGNLPNPGIEPGSPALQADAFTIWATREVHWATREAQRSIIIKNSQNLNYWIKGYAKLYGFWFALQSGFSKRLHWLHN